MTILDALRDPRLLGALPAFGDLSSWRVWLVVLAAIYGLPLAPADVDVFRELTGRSMYAPPAGGYREVVLSTGRQAGKSRIAGLIGAWEAAQSGGRGEYAVILGQDRTASTRALAGYAFEPFLDDASLFSQAVIGRTQETVSLSTGCTLAVYPCRPASVRGIRARVVLLDELDFMSSPDGRDVAREVVTAARPCVATTGGRIIALSSPGRSGSFFHSMVTRHWGDDSSPVLVVRAPAPTLNPRLSADYLDRMRAEDPDAYRSEVLGEWVDGTSRLFDEQALAASVVAGRRELPPEACTGKLAAFVDPAAGARGGDRFALAIGYRDGAAVRVAALRAWSPPFSPAAVVAEVADLCRSYGLRAVTGDRFAGNVLAEQFRAAGLAYEAASLTASDLYLDAVPVFQSGAVELPDPSCSETAADLMAELRSVVRKPGGAGRDRAEVARGSGRRGHGDLANAVCGLIAALPAKKERPRVAPPVSVGLRRNPWSLMAGQASGPVTFEETAA